MSPASAAFLERHAKLLRALGRFGDVLAKQPRPGDDLADAAIQRFEFSFETFWRVLRAALETEGVDSPSPRAALRGAYAAGWIEDEALWLGMLRARNLTSRTYDAETAQTVLKDLPAYHAAMRAAAEALPGRLTPD